MRAFSPQADAAIGEVMAWLHDWRDVALLPIEPFQRPAYVPCLVARELARRQRNRFAISEKEASLLRIMAKHCAHTEIGGRAIREASDYQNGGAVIGRTQWIGKPDWAMDYSQAEIQAAVEKAIGGAWLGERQDALIEVMLSEIAATRANCAQTFQAPECPF